jgi:uncharacterized C2H2 Zn-finger protein
VPERVIKILRFEDSDAFVRCDRCGAIGDIVEEVDHHASCPTVVTDTV